MPTNCVVKKYYLKVYGCSMNYADGEKVRMVMNMAGGQEVDRPALADIIILVSCSVRQQAEDKTAGWIIKIREESLDVQVVLTGCMAMRYKRECSTPRGKSGKPLEKFDSKYKKSLERRFPWIDYIVPIQEVGNLPKLLKLKGKSKRETYYSKMKHGDIEKLNYIDIPNNRNHSIHGLFPISTGCDNFCSYCIVPYTRGKLQNYPSQKILTDIRQFVRKGGKLVTLLGQNVNSWRDNIDGRINNGVQKHYARKISSSTCKNTLRQNNSTKNMPRDFVWLLKEVAKIKGDFWINFLSSNPMDFDKKLANLLLSEPKLMKWSHLAVQSGSDKILQKMNRKYTVAQFREIVGWLQDSIKFRITTDMIVGFPGETKEDFQKSLKLAEDLDLEMIYTAKFSPRKGTKAAEMPDTISLIEKKRRENLIRQVINNRRLEKHKALLGQEISVLLLGDGNTVKDGENKAISYYNHDVLIQESNSISHASDNMEESRESTGFKTGKVVDFSKAGLVVEIN